MHRNCGYPLAVRGQFLLWLAVSCLAFSATAWAKDNPSYTQVGHTINVGPNDQVGDVTCFGCSIHVRGQVAGDVTTFGGSITIEDQAQVSGDATAFAGDLRLTKDAKVDGDATVFGGQLRRDPEAQVGGDVTTMGGRGWIALIFVAPLIVMGLFVALLIWLIQWLRRPAMPAAA
ncbi:MAG: polymer-forming cytoskeletal protein [Acidobacteriia bacterium]|nr:polymer-forming cytoskeletal protein [Terriglobia bacterium]